MLRAALASEKKEEHVHANERARLKEVECLLNIVKDLRK